MNIGGAIVRPIRSSVIIGGVEILYQHLQHRKMVLRF